MSAMTDYLENKVLNLVLRATAFSPPGTVYLALFTDATTDAGGGTEVAGGSYARKAVTFASPGTPGVTDSTGEVRFTNMPVGTVTHAALFDAISAGNMLLHAPLTASKTLAAGDNLVFNAGDIDAIFS